MMKQRIFCDMDGVVVIFNEGKSLEDLFVPGYFRNLEPMTNMLQAIKRLSQDSAFEVFTLSHVLSVQAREDKSAWLDQHLPEIDTTHRIFVPYGENKGDFIPRGILFNDVLLDDFSPNLHRWEAISIKVLNGINWSKKSWTGHVVSALADPHKIATAVRAISCFENELRIKAGA